MASHGVPWCAICGQAADQDPKLSRHAQEASGGLWLCKPCIDLVLATIFRLDPSARAA
jgi:hypothetical protein